MSKWEKNYYDATFKKFTDIFFNGLDIDWQWFKAQAIAESNMEWEAVSSAGARGIMQIMPETWKEIMRDLNLPYNREHPEGSIHAGIYYDRKMWDVWSTKRTTIERLKLMFASYNAGVGNILKAQKLAEKWEQTLGTNSWSVISVWLNDVTGRKNSEQTIDYVDKIQKIYDKMVISEKSDLKPEAPTNKITTEDELIECTIKKWHDNQIIWKVSNTNLIELEDTLNELEENFDILKIMSYGQYGEKFTIISKRKDKIKGPTPLSTL